MIWSRILNLSALLAIAIAALPDQARATLLLNENFSTYASGNLVGQNGWTQLARRGTSTSSDGR